MILGISRAVGGQVPPVPRWAGRVCSLGGGATFFSGGAASHHAEGGVTVVAEAHGRAAGRTDAQKVAAAFRNFGHGCVARLAGGFRFLVHDSTTGEIFAASSTAPSWPLAYWSDSRTTVVGSRLLSLLEWPEVPRSLDDRYLAHLVMGLSSMADGTTALHGIRRLCPGEALVVRADGAHLSRVDELAPREVHGSGRRGANLFIDELATAIRDATDSQRTAVSFSGGLDSAALAVAGQKHGLGLPMYSFTARSLGTDAEVRSLEAMEHAIPGLQRVPLDVSHATAFPDLGPALRDDPPLVPLALLPARMELWKRVSQDGLRVLIEGEGGDELFSLLPTPVDAMRGGHFFDVARQVAASRSPRTLVKHRLLFPLLPPTLRRAWSALREPMDSQLPAFAAWDAKQHPAVRQAVDELRAGLVHRPFAGRLQEWLSAPLVVGAALSRRHIAARFGLELAWPLLERNVLELVLGLHQRRLIRSGTHKTFLQDALEGVVPDEVRLHPKEIGLYKAFIPRVLTSVRSREALRNGRVRARLAELVRFERVDGMLDGLAAGRQVGMAALWHLECLVSFAEWYAAASSEHGVS